MDPKEFERKLRAFFESELPGEYYQCMITHTDGKHDPKNPASIRINMVAVSNANPMNTPFALFHGLMKTMEVQARNIFVNIYGGELKPEQKEGPQEPYF